MSTANNQTCFMQTPSESSPPLIQSGKIVIQAHHIGWAVTGLFTIISSIVSFWLVNKHLRWYTKKNEQRYIVRILFMVPIYSVVSFASYLFWNQSTPLLLVRDCYESTVLTSFFYLILNYLSPDADEQRAILQKDGLSKESDRLAIRKGEPVKKWMFPLGSVKSKPRDGLYFLQIMKRGILQYCVVRPVTTLAAVILDQVGFYCVDSWSPGWGHLYITIIVSISVSIAMYCLLQLYFPISKRLASHQPMLKFLSIKSVVFLTFWQATFLSLLSFFGIVKDTKYMTADDINIGIGAVLETVEMTFFAFLHLKAFSYKPYYNLALTASHDYGMPYSETRMSRLRALGHAFDFRETFRELWFSCVYMLRNWRGKETDRNARRLNVKAEIFGQRHDSGSRSRSRHRAEKKGGRDLSFDPVLKNSEKQETLPLAVAVDVEEQVHVNMERQWLGTGDDYIYGIGFSRRERSAGLADQIDEELSQRGITNSILRATDNKTARKNSLTTGDVPAHRKQRSWWQNIYRRLSRSSHDDVWEKQALTADFSANEISNDADKKQWSPDSPTPGIVLPTLAERSESVTSSRRNDFAAVTPSSMSHDPVLTRLFNSSVPGKTISGSEASGPSSQTHPTSHGHHVRLMAPAQAIPSEEWRASVRRPYITKAEDDQNNSRGQIAWMSRKKPTSSSKHRMSTPSGYQAPRGIVPINEATNDYDPRQHTPEIHRSHRRERADHGGNSSKDRHTQKSAGLQRSEQHRVAPIMPPLLGSPEPVGESGTLGPGTNSSGLAESSRRNSKVDARTSSSAYPAPFDPMADLTRSVAKDGPYAYVSRIGSGPSSSPAPDSETSASLANDKPWSGPRTS